MRAVEMPQEPSNLLLILHMVPAVTEETTYFEAFGTKSLLFHR